MNSIGSPREELETIIQMASKDKKPESPVVIKTRNAMTGTGALLGAYAGTLRGMETGGAVSAIQGMAKTKDKFQQYAQEDAAHEAQKNHERYMEIEGPHGERTKMLKDRVTDVKPTFKERLGSLGNRIKKTSSEIPTKAKYMAEDALHGTGKWLKRSSLSRSVAIGALAGAGIGRYLGGKAGRSIDRSNKVLAKQREQSKIRRQATEIAKADAMARAISEAMKQRQMSARDAVIQFAIDINPKNRGKLTETEHKTGKSVSELENSKNPKTRKRANFARMAKRHFEPLHKMSAREQLGSILNFGTVDEIDQGASTFGGSLRDLIQAGAATIRALAARKKIGTNNVNAIAPQQPRQMSARDQLLSIINFKALDLAEEDRYPGDCLSEQPRKKRYPTLYVSDRENDFDLPLEGMAKVRYKLRSKTIRQNEEGKRRHSADIEIQSIDPIEEDIKKSGVKLLNISPTSPMKRFSALKRPAWTSTDIAQSSLSARDQLNPIINLDIHLDPSKKGSFTKTEARTGKSAEELKHSKNPLTRKRANFAIVARSWHHGKGEHKMSAREILDDIISFSRGDQLEKWRKNVLGLTDAPDPRNEAILKKDIRGFKKAIEPEVRKQLAIDMPPSRKVFRAAMGENSTRARLLNSSIREVAAMIKTMRHPMDHLAPLRRLSARDQLNLIINLDSRPRNAIGEFESQGEEGPSASAIGMVYKNPSVGRDIATSTAGGLAGAGLAMGGKSLIEKLKAIRMRK